MPPRRTAATANEDKCTNAQKPSAQHSEIQRTASLLLASLLEACQEDARFSHLKEMPYVKEDRLDDDLHDSILDFIEQVEVADDLTPLTMEKMNKVAKSLRRALNDRLFNSVDLAKSLRRALNDRKLAPTPKPLASTTAKLARFETKNAASVSKATSAPKRV